MNSITPIQQLHSGKPGFPLRLFAAAFVISLLTGVFGGWQAWQMHNRFQELSDKQAHVTEDIGRIMLFEEVLTMSARMAAATGESAYEKRYDQFDAQLTAVINHVRADLPQLEIEPFIRETDEANRALVKMERQAFALMHQGRRQEAMALLTGNEYLRLKKVYAGGMEKTADAMKLVLKREQRHLHYLTDLAAVANVVGILVLLAAWFFAARSARSWAAERREAEEALRKARDELEDRVEQRTAEIQRLSQLFNLLSQCNQAVVRSANEDELFQHICRDAVQLGGFKLAWIGLVDEASKQVKPVASYGEGVEYLDDIRISVDADSPFGRGPTGISIRENQPFWSQDFLNDPVTAPWHEGGTRFGWSSSASLPLHRNGVAIGAFMLYSGKANAFDEAVRKLLVEMARDISFALDHFAIEAERKAAELQLAEHEMQYRTLADSGQALIWASGTDKLCNYFNQPWLKFTGRTLEQELGNGWAEGVHPDDVAQCLATYVAAFDRREPFSMAYRLHRHDGEYRWIQDDGCPRYNNKGEFIGYIGYGLDITERKGAEESVRTSQARLRTIFNQAPLGIALIDSFTGQIYEVNPRFAEIAGRTIEEMATIDWMSITHPDDVQEDLDNMALLNAGKIPGFRMEKRYIRPDGSFVWINMTIAPLRVEQNISPRHLCMIDDITERKQAEAKLAEQFNELRQWHEATLRREMRTLELKHEVNELLGRAGQPPRYPSAEQSNAE